jgi:mRNA interferase MazF
MKEGDIILATILMSDSTFKKRATLILKILPKFGDLLLCGISSQLNQYISDFDLLINQNSSDFSNSGLVKDSIIRLGYLSVLPSQFIEGKLGNISQETHRLLIERLCIYLSN